MVFVILIPGSATVEAKDFERMSSWDRAVYDSLENPTPDTAACFEVKGASEWQTDVGLYRFESGTITFLQTVTGRPTGCHFSGSGRVEYEPPTPIERGQLYRYFKDSALSNEFTELSIWFYDSIVATELLACCDPSRKAAPAKPGALDDWKDRADDDLFTSLAKIGWLTLQRPQAPHAYLIITGKFVGQEPLYFIVDDSDEEAVGLLRRPNLLAGRGELEVVCSYDRRRTPEEAARREGLLHGGIQIAHYQTDVTIKPSTEMVIDARLTIEPQRDSLRDLLLYLVPDLEIDGVYINGDSADYSYSDEASGVCIVSPHRLPADTPAEVRILYRGDELLYKFIWGDFFINYTTRWLPVTGRDRTRAEYETVFRFPKHYDLVSCGQLLGDSLDGDWRIKRWKTYDPSAYVSFNYGSFDVLKDTVDKGPALEIYRSKNHLTGLFGGDMKKSVAADVNGAMQLFSKMFGPYPWPQLAATEIPGYHGQGLPQLLHLAWFSFESNTPGVTDHFRAHEVAHQWFGHLVGWTNYHDQWLSEGFAEYAGAMYVQASNKDKDKFWDILKQWRSDVLDVGGHSVWHAGPHVAPIWLGYRCSSTSSPASYGHLIYSKGAYVLHMLRNMLHDYRTGSDSRFAALMRDYVDSHAHADATTADFQQVVERHVRTDMSWFFDQWVYGTQIPRYEYSWEREKTEGGQWVVRGRVDQHDVDSTFRVFMPITLEFDEGRRTFVHEIIGDSASFVTPPLAERPKNVVFNDYLTILCREKTIRKP
jgi:hypothetical protein